MKAATLGAVLACLLAGTAQANGLGENVPWQFQTTQDKVNKGVIVDLIEKKKGGFYDSYSTTVNNNSTTYIDKQFNCSQTSGATGNADTSSLVNSSPTVSPNSALNSGATGNSGSNSLAQSGQQGVLVAGLNTPPSGGSSLTSAQSNTGFQSSDIAGSSSSTNTGPVSTSGSAALNSTLSNTGYQQSSIQGSTACSGLRTN
ncbi:MAG TPA: hypothetical protein VLJ58_18520 [Ramlibacter sp.]|nr:hypothetical protein [Ramlibacter sp.]